MRRSVLVRFCIAATILSAALPSWAQETASDPATEAGREIWLKAAGGSERLLSSLRPALTGAPIDWYAALAADRRDRLFDVWGLVPSPGCCVPGADGCPAESTAQTFGFAWCEGDDVLLEHVGQRGYPDPACTLADAPIDPDHPHGRFEQRESACSLGFGTSAGAVGLRKFPNPRFNPERWREAGGWEGSVRPDAPDGIPVPPDLSIEPPFLIGLSCAACHAGPDPENPPEDPANPSWDQIDLLAGNPWSRLSALLASGLPPYDLDAWALGSAPPGSLPVTPLPGDPASMPAAVPPLIGSASRPLFEHEVVGWRPTQLCPEGAPRQTCWCEAGRPGKCWQRSRRVERVPHLGHGGEDAAGLATAVQRANLAMGSCAMTCEALQGLGRLGESGHGTGAIDPGLCRIDCPAFRAVEDRLGEVVAFIETGRPASLWRARGLGDNRDLEIALDTAYFPEAVQEGRALFARHCARCHSSQEGVLGGAVFDRTGGDGEALDWLGRETLHPVEEVGTDGARAAAPGFGRGERWSAFGSQSRDPLGEPPSYRAPTLQGIWASAPYLHNNAVGPELCSAAITNGPLPWRSPHVGPDGMPLDDPPDCRSFDPSVRERYRLFEASMSALLSPGRRLAKLPTLDRPLLLEWGPSTPYSGTELGLRFILQPGLPAALATGLDYARIVDDLGLEEGGINEKYADMGERQRRLLADGIAEARTVIGTAGEVSRLRVMSGLDRIAAATGPGEVGLDSTFLQTFYGTTSPRTNEGHRFGESLTGREKRALIAFLATL